MYYHIKTTILPSETSKGWINAVGSVGGGHDDHMTTLLHAVHQREKLGHDTSLHLSMSLLEHMYEEASVCHTCMLIVLMCVAL